MRACEATRRVAVRTRSQWARSSRGRLAPRRWFRDAQTVCARRCGVKFVYAITQHLSPYATQTLQDGPVQTRSECGSTILPPLRTSLACFAASSVRQHTTHAAPIIPHPRPVAPMARMCTVRHLESQVDGTPAVLLWPIAHARASCCTGAAHCHSCMACAPRGRPRAAPRRSRTS